MINQIPQYCKVIEHAQLPIVGLCLNKNCIQNISPCLKCLEQHNEHMADFIQFDELTKISKNLQQTIINKLMSLDKIAIEIQVIIEKLRRPLLIKKMIYDSYLEKQFITNCKGLQETINDDKQNQDINDNHIKKIYDILEIVYNLKREICEVPDHLIQESQSLIGEGNELFLSSKYDQALNLYESVLSIDPHNLEGLIRKARTLKALTKYDQAILYFDKVLEINPLHIQSLFLKGDCLRLTDKHEESLKWFEKVLEIDPQHFNSTLYYGESLRKLKKYKEAYECFQKATLMEPKNYLCHFGRGECLRHLKQKEESVKALTLALEINPMHSLSMYSLGYSLKSLKKYDEAKKVFERCIQINPKYEQELLVKIKECDKKLAQQQAKK